MPIFGILSHKEIKILVDIDLPKINLSKRGEIIPYDGDKGEKARMVTMDEHIYHAAEVFLEPLP